MRGGSRTGAGRKAMPDGIKRTHFSCTVAPATAEAIRRHAEKTGLPVGRIVDDLVEELLLRK